MEAPARANSHGRIVGYLHSPVDVLGLQGKRPIYANYDLRIGRDNRVCDLVLLDPTVSNQHLRIYCILFEQEEESQIAPLVYAEDLSRNGTYWNGALIGKGNGGVLLSDGDVLRISPRLSFSYSGVTSLLPEPLDETQEREKKLFQQQYIITGRKIGAGGFGRVYIALDKTSERQLACKIVDLRKLREKHLRDVVSLQEPNQVDEKLKKYAQEAEILRNLSHPNIIALEKVFRTNNTIYIFEDLITAGDLFSYVDYKGGKLEDVEAAVVIRQILKALEYLHERGIVHRDLKPDNILVTSLADGSRVVLSDFGAAAIVGVQGAQHQRMLTRIGTLEYAAPEVYGANKTMTGKHGYTKSVDMWSLGGVAATLLSGGSLFIDSKSDNFKMNPDEAILKLAAECNLAEMDKSRAWQHVGERPKDFIKNLLVLDEGKRLTVKQALEHPWFTNEYHRQEFDSVYSRAIKHWRPRPKKADIIEILDIGKPSASVHPKRSRSKPQSRSPSRRALMPIEPPYMPFHRRLNQLVSPRRESKSFSLSASVPPKPLKTNRTRTTFVDDASPLQQKAIRTDLACNRLQWPTLPRTEQRENQPETPFTLTPSPSSDTASFHDTIPGSIETDSEDELALVPTTPPTGKLTRPSRFAECKIELQALGDTLLENRKRRGSSVYDFEDDGTYDEVGRSITGWTTALSFGKTVYKRRKEKDLGAISADMTDSIRTALDSELVLA